MTAPTKPKPFVDKRTIEFRELKKLIADLNSDFAPKSTIKQRLVARLAFALTRLDCLERHALSGDTIDTDIYCKLIDAIDKLLSHVRVQRPAQQILRRQ